MWESLWGYVIKSRNKELIAKMQWLVTPLRPCDCLTYHTPGLVWQSVCSRMVLFLPG